MHFNTIIFTVLALLNLISARFHVLSPLVDSVWTYGGKHTVEWRVKDPDHYGYSSVSIFLVCLHDRSTRVVFDIASNLSVSSSSYEFHVPQVSDCEHYLVKFVAGNSCGVNSAFFSSSFFITHDGKPRKTLLTLCDTDKTVPPKEKPATESKPKPTKPAETKTQTSSSSKLPPPSSQQGPVPSDGSQTFTVPKPTPTATQEPKKPDTPSTKPKDSSSPSAGKDKKPDDIENNGSIITYKFFGIILGTIVAFICS